MTKVTPVALQKPKQKQGLYANVQSKISCHREGKAAQPKSLLQKYQMLDADTKREFNQRFIQQMEGALTRGSMAVAHGNDVFGSEYTQVSEAKSVKKQN